MVTHRRLAILEHTSVTFDQMQNSFSFLSCVRFFGHLDDIMRCEGKKKSEEEDEGEEEEEKKEKEKTRIAYSHH